MIKSPHLRRGVPTWAPLIWIHAQPFHVEPTHRQAGAEPGVAGRGFWLMVADFCTMYNRWMILGVPCVPRGTLKMEHGWDGFNWLGRIFYCFTWNVKNGTCLVEERSWWTYLTDLNGFDDIGGISTLVAWLFHVEHWCYTSFAGEKHFAPSQSEHSTFIFKLALWI